MTTEVYYRTSNGISTDRRPYRDGTYWTVVGTNPTGEARNFIHGDCTFHVTDGLRTFVQEGTGSTDTLLIPAYFQRTIPLPTFEGHDICSYCGQSNGPNGELRKEHDCCWCGSN